jgi:FkbM family methyltransferase
VLKNILKKIEPHLPPFIRTRARRFVIEVFQWIGVVFDVEKKSYYGQIGEDASLRYYLTEKDGFFVDIGAFAPRKYSNTYWFYRSGWRGINIDATPGSMKEFRIPRKRDINIEVGVSCTEGIQHFYTWSTKAQNTFSEKTAEIFSRDLMAEPIVIDLVTRRLDKILDEYLPEGQKINLMSVDVEGREMDVLRSNDWDKYRPSWLVVEILQQKSLSHMLCSNVASYLSEKGYEIFAWMPPNAYFVENSAKK